MDDTLEFKTLGTQKYLLKIASKMNLGGFSSDNEVEIRWMLSLKDITHQSYTFELITLDHAMIKADNSGYIEVHKLVTQMQKALNEITFTIDKQGNLIKVDNLGQIQERWQAVKSEMIEYNRSNTSLEDLFKIQDEIFEKQGGVENMVKAMEFFDIYLNMIYGRDYFHRISKKIPNLFRTGEIPFALKYESNAIKEGVHDVNIEGYPNILSETHTKDLYGSFPFVDANTVKPLYGYNAHYIVDSKGFIEEGEINFIEYVNEKLGGEIHYKLQQYE